MLGVCLPETFIESCDERSDSGIGEKDRGVEEIGEGDEEGVGE